MALSPAPARFYPNLDALEQALINSKMDSLNAVLSNFDIKQINQTPSFYFPFSALANVYPEPGKPVCFFDSAKSLGDTLSLYHSKKIFGRKVKRPLQDFFLRLTEEKSNDLYTNSTIQDIILDLIEQKFIDRIKFRTLFLKNLKTP